MAKLAPRGSCSSFEQITQTRFFTDVLVGFDTSDDAGVFKLNETTALVQTLDFFTPIADDPETYGQIAAINSLNDVYADGGQTTFGTVYSMLPQKG